MKIIALSDSNGHLRPLHLLRQAYPDADLFLHLGNHGLAPRDTEGYVCVAGNIEKDDDVYPVYRVMELGSHKAFIAHGNTFFNSNNPDYKAIIDVAKNMGCDICIFGHARIYLDETVDGIRLLNPGSVFKNRDNTPPCYMVIEIDENGVNAKRMDYQSLTRGNKDEG